MFQSSAPPQVPPAPLSAPAPQPPASQFTQMFQNAQKPSAPTPPPPMQAAPAKDFSHLFAPGSTPSSNPVTQPPKHGQLTTEFNKLFDGPPRPAPTKPPAGLTTGGRGSGSLTMEFNKLFEDLPASQRPILKPPAPPPPGAGGGEFTQMFQSGGATAAPPVAPAGSEFTQMFAQPSGAKGPQKPKGFISAQEGETTRMFQTPQRSVPPPPKPPMPPPLMQMPQMPPPPVLSAPPAGAAGEFTQMFQSPGGSAPPSPPPPPAQNSAGEFTQFYTNPMSGSSSGPSAGASFPMPPSASTPLAPPKPKAADDFEELFGGVNATQRPNPIQQQTGPPGLPGGGGLTATAQFNTPVASRPPAGMGAGGPMAPPPTGGGGGGQMAPPGYAPAAAAGAGSYTQMMQAPVGAQPLIGQNPPPGGKKAPLPPAKKGVPTMVFVGIGIFVFILLSVVLYLVLKKTS